MQFAPRKENTNWNSAVFNERTSPPVLLELCNPLPSKTFHNRRTRSSVARFFHYNGNNVAGLPDCINSIPLPSCMVIFLEFEFSMHLYGNTTCSGYPKILVLVSINQSTIFPELPLHGSVALKLLLEGKRDKNKINTLACSWISGDPKYYWASLACLVQFSAEPVDYFLRVARESHCYCDCESCGDYLTKDFNVLMRVVGVKIPHVFSLVDCLR